jgi:ligand-binding sensor domain-containing protein
MLGSLVSCEGQTTTRSILSSAERNINIDSTSEDSGAQIAEYVTSIFEDSKGNLWFGTIDKGIALYNGSQLRYFTTKDGLPSNRVIEVIEDSNGIFWFGTGEGLSRYDGKNFTNFLVGDGFNSNMISKLFIDSKNTFWVGTWNGVYKFDGKVFQSFVLPYPAVDTPINQDTKDWIKGISEDSNGSIWFRRDGYGICIYDGNSFSHILKEDGLHSNYVTSVQFDKDGSVWIGTRVAERDNPDSAKRNGKGGVNKIIDNKFISFPEIKELNDGDVYKIYRDKSDHIWISTTSNGVYKYDGKTFKNYNIPISIMSIKEDQKGILWMGGAGGLYKINQKEEIINVTTQGPW